MEGGSIFYWDVSSLVKLREVKLMKSGEFDGLYQRWRRDGSIDRLLQFKVDVVHGIEVYFHY